MVLSSIQTVLSNHFLQPIGLLALLGLVPLIIFYLIKKKPEEQIMPAMMFFMKDRKTGKASQALKTLLRNILLIFHIFLIAGIAAALAQPVLNTPAVAEQTVIVFDNSASMSNNMVEAKSFVEDNLGKTNTLIIVGNRIDVPLESGSADQVMTALKKVESKDVESDVANAVELAADYKGTIIIASDLDQTESQKSAEKIVENLRDSGRDIRVKDFSGENAWGIINVEPGKDNSSIDVKNFLRTPTTVTITKDNTEKNIDIKPNEVKTVTFSTSTGKNVIQLEDDGFDPDNKAYISVPEEDNYQVAFITENGNPYFQKALDLISFTTIETYNPPVNKEIDADIYVVDDTNRVLSETVGNIENDVKNGASLVVFAHSGIFNLDLKSLPVKQTGNSYETTVQINKPRTITIGNTNVVSANKTRGKSYASPEEAMVKASYGEGEVFFYNIDDEDFHFDFIYPVFWKQVLKELVDRPSIHDLNLETGDEINATNLVTPSGETKSGVTELDHAGFYETANRVYAVNLESEDESYSEKLSINTDSENSSFEKRNVQNLALLLLALLMLGELSYLARIGDI